MNEDKSVTDLLITVLPRKDATATIYFNSTAMWRLFEDSYYSKYRRRGYYLFQCYHNAATIRGRLLFEGGYYLRAAIIRGNTVYMC